MCIYTHIHIHTAIYIYIYIYIYTHTQQSLDPILYILKSARCLPYSGSSCFNDSS